MKNLLKKLGKGIKTGFKSIGKAFKKVFKGIGKFIGKLGPIGMLGMMLLMPQLGAWWGQFGKWAGTLVENGKFFGNVMKGIHQAGATVGNAYNTVTGGIKRTLNAATGGTFDAIGTVGYEEGFSDKFANWMSGQLDKGRDFLGLETQQGLQVTKATEALNLPEGVSELPEGWSIEETQFKAGQQVTDKINIRGPDGDLYLEGSADFNFELKTDLASRAGTLEPVNLDPSAYEYVYTPDGQFSKNLEWKKGTSGVTGTGAAAEDVVTKEDSFLKKSYQGVTTASTAYTLGQQILGKGYDDDAAYSGLVAETALPMYESVNVNWTDMGYAGQPLYGSGSPYYFQSVVDYSNNDPYYQYLMTRTA